MKKITVKRAAELLGKGELFVRECMKDGSLPIGTVTRLPGSNRWNFSISPRALAEYLGCSVNALYGEECTKESTGKGLFTEEQIKFLCNAFERVLREAKVYSIAQEE